MSPVVHSNNHNNSITYYNNMPHYHHHPQVTSPSFSSASSITSSSSSCSSSSVSSSAARLGQIRAQLELARNFYDDFEFCPIQCSSEVLEHRDRVQQRLSPQSSPNTSPSMSFANRNPHHQNSTPKSRRAIPIIDPSNMAPVSVPNQQFLMKSSPIYNQQQQQQQQFWSTHNSRSRSPMNAGGYYDVLVQ
ncbi:hypothetical protein BD770DRAFT_395183 [Pilaira anomala]|nr:hypothetical protein BD770DRAFT_395183 [Pilaira anomala]